MVVNDSVTSELARYKELVGEYEKRAKFELTDRERKIDEQMRIIISDRNRKETSLKSELHSAQILLSSTVDHYKSKTEEVTLLKKDFKQKEDKFLEEFLDIKKLKDKIEDRLYKQDQSVQTVHMLCQPKSFYDEKHKVAIGYKNPLCLARAKQAQSALYNGHVLVTTNHAPTIIHDSEDTLELAAITRNRMRLKMQSPLCRKTYLLKDKQIPSVGVFDEEFQAVAGGRGGGEMALRNNDARQNVTASKEILKDSAKRWLQESCDTGVVKILVKSYDHHISGSPIVTIKLTGTENYKVWSIAMTFALRNHNKLGFIDGSREKDNTNPALANQWDMSNSINDLKDTYDKVDGFAIFILHKNINSLNQSGVFLVDYYNNLNSLWKRFDAMVSLPACTYEAAAHFEKHNHLIKLMQFLMGLNDNYLAIRSNILTRDPLPLVKIAFAIVSGEESHRNITSVETTKPTATAFAAKTFDKKRSFELAGYVKKNFSSNTSIIAGHKSSIRAKVLLNITSKLKTSIHSSLIGGSFLVRLCSSVTWDGETLCGGGDIGVGYGHVVEV
ncbi:retrovirus-related pol polyprotein from transposon TNT 1-94 [Tanacetum coccineum]